MKIIPATAAHAPLIARAIIMAITPELVEQSFAAEGITLAEAEEIFTTLAAGTASQYSHLNTLVALDDEAPGNPVMGLAVGYDGAQLHRLRDAFFDLVEQRHGATRLRGNVPDETSPDEFYIDTLAVWPEYRRKGVGAALLRAMAARAAAIGKPAGLLVDKTNPRARRLYDAVGFRQVGERFFFDTMMNHLQIPVPCNPSR